MATIVTNGVLNSVRNGSSRRRMAECIAEWLRERRRRPRVPDRPARRSTSPVSETVRWSRTLAGFRVFSMRPRHGQTVSLVPFAAKREDDRRVRAALAMRAPLRIVQIELSGLGATGANGAL